MSSAIFPATLDSLAGIRMFVGGSAETVTLQKGACYKLVLAVDEIVTNAINYGYAGRSGEIVVHAEQAADEFVVTVEDTAPAFDPKSIALPTEGDIAAPLDERKIGGLGVYLVLKDIDRFEYRRDGSKNVNIFAMKIKS